MTPDEIATLAIGDYLLHQGQLFLVAQVGLPGGQIRLIGKTYDQILRATRKDMELVYRKANVPPDIQPGWLTAEQEAAIQAIIAERKARETRKEWR